MDRRVLVTHDRKTMPQQFAEFITNKNQPWFVSNSSITLPQLSAVEELLLICDRDRRMGQPHLHLATVRSVMSNATKEAHATIAEARICERPSGRRGKCGNL